MTRISFYLFAVISSFVLLANVSCSKSTMKSSSDMNEPKSNENGGGPKKPGKTGTKLEPCTVVTKADLKKITGIDFTNTTPQGNVTGLSTCDYVTADGKYVLGIIIVRSNAKKRLEFAGKFPKTKPITDFGDEAVWSPVNGLFDVRKGNDAVGVRVSRSIGDDMTRIKYAKAIATLVFERI